VRVPQEQYVVATIRPWNIAQYHSSISKLPGSWHLVTDPAVLTIEYLTELKPRYIFFPHWSVKVPNQIVEKYECVCFHETDLPFGRGGSPIQNLIARGYKDTVVSALRMAQKLDTGPVYLKRALSLEGTAEEIFSRSAQIISGMIRDIITGHPTPAPQTGKPTMFERRKPEQSEITAKQSSLERLFDHIRMLDAAEYPQAFFERNGFRFEFRRAVLRNGGLEADVKITSIKADEE